ncbi:MAG: tetratricopeptide repeat protein [Ketobacteraceae bacterium]|nr:tetratricopeptide repeat protein [Ketobacteraceae bacterium]
MNKITQLLKILMLTLMIAGCDELDTKQQVDSSQVLARAESYLDQGQFRAASIEARKALQENPDNPDAHVIIARIMLEVGQPQAAINQLEKSANEKDPRFLLTLAEAYIDRGKFFSAREVLEPNEKMLKDYNEYKYTLLYAMMQKGFKEYEAAKKSFERAEEVAGSNDKRRVRVLIEKAKHYLDQNDEKNAEKALDQALALKQNSEALLHKGSLAFKRGEFDKAEDHLSNALIELANTDIITPTKIKILKGLIETLTQSGRSSEALIYSKLLAEEVPDAEKNESKFMDALKLYREGKLEESEQLLAEIYSGVANDYSGRMLGLINAIQGDLTEADTFLTEHVDPETASSKAVRVLAETKLRLNQTDEALAILEEKVSQSPNDPEILSIYGLAQLSAGQTEKAAATIKKTLAIEPNKPRLRIALANIYARKKEFDKAKQELLTAYDSDPGNEEVVVALGKLYLATGAIADARKLSQKVLKNSPDSAFAHGFAGSIAFAAKDYGNAVQHYKKSAELSPKNEASRFGLARAYIGQGNYEQAIAELQSVMEQAPNAPQVYKAFILAHELNGSVEQALKEVKLISDKDIQAWAPLTVMAEYQMQSRQPDSAVELIEQALTRNAIEVYPKNVAMAAYHMAASKALQSQEYEHAREMLLKGLQLSPDDLRFQAMLTGTEIKSGNIREAEKVLQQLEAAHPESPVVTELKGDIEVTGKQFESALTFYQQAWEESPSDSLGNKIYRLKARLKQDSDEFLKEWESKLPKSESVAILKAIEYHQANQIEEAIRQYEKALEMNPNLLTAINNLAWIRFEQGKPGALELAEDGAARYPESAAMLDTYGWILAETGNKTKAREILKKAHELAPDNEEIRKHYESVR